MIFWHFEKVISYYIRYVYRKLWHFSTKLFTLYFIKLHFMGFCIFFCKIANHYCDVIWTFQGRCPVSVLVIKFLQALMSINSISRYLVFFRFWSEIYRPDELCRNLFSDFVPPYQAWNLAKIIGRNTTNRYNLRVKESFFILRDSQNINIQGSSIPLVLFTK